MKTKAKHPEPVSRTIQSKSKAANQAPISQILQRYKAQAIQRQDMDEDELLQGKFDGTAQRMESDEDEEIPIQAVNRTGLPDNLKTGVENLSGYNMDDVRVHYNSSKPAQLQALAYTQGTDIHVAPGQEKHLPHEAWHVVQQKQGRVQPTMQLQGVNVNDNEGLEREADIRGSLSKKTNNILFKRNELSSTNTTQLKHYDANNNKIIGDRPPMTEEIKNAKKGLDEKMFTAHHKYPWEHIKSDIETAFKTPKEESSEQKFNDIINFSKTNFPIEYEKFIINKEQRVQLYSGNESKIDEWIQRICWIPGNIFIGPLSNNRLDDPSTRDYKRNDRLKGYDGHFTRLRSKSIRSQGIEEKGIGHTFEDEENSNSVAEYNPKEWEDPLNNGEYYQINDPYFEEKKKIPYKIEYDKGINLALPQQITIKVPIDVALGDVTYFKYPENDLIIHTVSCAESDKKTKKYTVKFNETETQYKIINNIEITLSNTKTNVKITIKTKGFTLKSKETKETKS